jgi:hypothetical protein
MPWSTGKKVAVGVGVAGGIGLLAWWLMGQAKAQPPPPCSNPCTSGGASTCCPSGDTCADHPNPTTGELDACPTGGPPYFVPDPSAPGCCSACPAPDVPLMGNGLCPLNYSPDPAAPGCCEPTPCPPGNVRTPCPAGYAPNLDAPTCCEPVGGPLEISCPDCPAPHAFVPGETYTLLITGGMPHGRWSLGTDNSGGCGGKFPPLTQGTFDANGDAYFALTMPPNCNAGPFGVWLEDLGTGVCAPFYWFSNCG